MKCLLIARCALLFVALCGCENQLKSDRSDEEAIRETIGRLETAPLDTNSFPLLLQSVALAGKLEKSTNHSAATELTYKIAEAYSRFGTTAEPLLPVLSNYFFSKRSIVPAAGAIVGIGGSNAGLILTYGLTNSDEYVRIASMRSLSSFATNQDVALRAVPPLLEMIKTSPRLRPFAVNLLGQFEPSSETVLPLLLDLARNDPDFVVRCMALKALGRQGTNAGSVAPVLLQIAASDTNHAVRAAASRAVQAVEGNKPVRGVNP